MARTSRLRNCLALALATALGTGMATAETLRIATFNVGLTRKGPGLLLADLRDGKAADAEAAAAEIRAADPDVLLLTGIDWDAGLVTLSAFDRLIGGGARAYPHHFALRPNTGMMTALDLDGDGRRGGPGDAQGFGRFAGQGGMALLSRLPVREEQVQDFSGLLWRDLPAADLPLGPNGGPFPSAEAQAAQRLSTTGHWDVPVEPPGGGVLHLLAWYASPPVFDGPEDRNGKRARDELRLWSLYLGGELGPRPEGPFVILGDANLDPERGEGDRAAMAAFLADPRITDPRPAADGETATALWPAPVGPMRVDYVLPSSNLAMRGAGLGRPEGEAAPVHRLVWVDIEMPAE